jgi:hypothetical protein
MHLKYLILPYRVNMLKLLNVTKYIDWIEINLGLTYKRLWNRLKQMKILNWKFKTNIED